MLTEKSQKPKCQAMKLFVARMKICTKKIHARLRSEDMPQDTSSLLPSTQKTTRRIADSGP